MTDKFFTDQFSRLSEKMDNINDKIGSTNEKVDTLNTVLAVHLEHCKNACARVDKHEKILTGLGNAGIVLKVDRLDQAHRKQTKLLWLCISALVPIIIGFVINFVSNMHSLHSVNATTTIPSTATDNYKIQSKVVDKLQ